MDSALPKILRPSIATAKQDRPTPYLDKCHTQQDLTASESDCHYGNKDSDQNIVLFGDSHALSWFPAIQKLAQAKGWGFYSLTMSSCWPANIPAWNSIANRLMTNCAIWRKATRKRITALKPTMIFVAGTRGFSTIDASGNVLTGAIRTAAWEKGMTTTISQLKSASKKVVYLGDTPISIVNVSDCLAAHTNSVAACSTPFSRAVSIDWSAEEKKIAIGQGITYVDPTPWICMTDPCSPIVGNYLIYVDGGHLTATFARSLEAPLWKELTTIKVS